jgi:hypothetical protein
MTRKTSLLVQKIKTAYLVCKVFFIIKIKHPNSTGNVRELLLFFRISFFECVLLNVRA